MKVVEDSVQDRDPILENFRSIAIGIAKTLGEKGEVVLHDLNNPESSLFLIAGDVTHRKIGAPCTDLVLSQLRAKKDPEDLLNYSVQLPDGRRIKSSIIFIRNLEGKIIGCLGINYDLTEMEMAMSTITSFSRTDYTKEEKRETFASTIQEIIEAMIKEAKESVGRSVPYMTKEDKVEVISYLEKKGAFLVKGSVDLVAQNLGVSRYTIYNYIKEVEERSV